MIEICYTVVSVFHWYQGMTTVPKNHMDVCVYIYMYGSTHYVVEKKTHILSGILHFKTPNIVLLIISHNHFFNPTIRVYYPCLIFVAKNPPRELWDVPHLESSGPQLIVSSPPGQVVSPLPQPRGGFVPGLGGRWQQLIEVNDNWNNTNRNTVRYYMEIIN